VNTVPPISSSSRAVAASLLLLQVEMSPAPTRTGLDVAGAASVETTSCGPSGPV
jgi:hypothetical protein